MCLISIYIVVFVLFFRLYPVISLREQNTVAHVFNFLPNFQIKIGKDVSNKDCRPFSSSHDAVKSPKQAQLPKCIEFVFHSLLQSTDSEQHEPEPRLASLRSPVGPCHFLQNGCFVSHDSMSKHLWLVDKTLCSSFHEKRSSKYVFPLKFIYKWDKDTHL